MQKAAGKHKLQKRGNKELENLFAELITAGTA
jgi:hypothetical protein